MVDLPPAIETAFGIDVAVCDLGPDFDSLAAATPEASLILVSPSVHPARQRFTLTHELGHLLGGDDQGVHQDADIERASKAKDPTEIRANAFAAAFLMPDDVVGARVELGFDEWAFCALACDLLVSPRALGYRLQNLALIDAGVARRYGTRSPMAAARSVDRMPLLAEAGTRSAQLRPPGLLTRDLYTAYLQGRTTLRPYARLMGTETRALRIEMDAPEEACCPVAVRTPSFRRLVFGHIATPAASTATHGPSSFLTGLASGAGRPKLPGVGPHRRGAS